MESGVSRIVDQVVEQKMDYIQSKVEEILYQYVGISKPIKKEKNSEEQLEVETDHLPTDLELEQVSPDSDKKSSLSDGLNMDEMKDEEVEEELVEDDDFESPAFEPIEAMSVDRNEQSQHSNLSAISGLTSQDSVENKSDPASSEVKDLNQPQDTQLSQISSLQDMMSQEAPESTPPTAVIPEEIQEVKSLEEKPEPMVEEPEKSQFDLKKDSIEFTGNERKSITLDDSTSSAAEAEKVLQPQDVPSNTMEIDNLYENDTTDSSEMRMEIDLKDETTQETGESSKIEESSQDSSMSKEKRPEQKKDSHHHHHKSHRSRDKHKSSSSSHKSSHQYRSSSSKSKPDDKHKSRSDGKSRSSSSNKKSSTDKDRSSSSRRDHDKDKKSSKDDSSRSKHRDHKTSDDHHQEKSSSRRRRSTDHDSNDGKNKPTEAAEAAGQEKNPNSTVVQTSETPQKTGDVKENKSDDLSLKENRETEFSPASSGSKKEPKSSILVKYDYLKSPTKSIEIKKIEDGFLGFTTEKLPDNPWFECFRKNVEKDQQKKTTSRSSNNNYLENRSQSVELASAKKYQKPKPKTLDSPGETSEVKLANGIDEVTPESRAQSIAQQQRYTTEDLFKPRFDFRRRSAVVEESLAEVKDSPSEEISKIDP